MADTAPRNRLPLYLFIVLALSAGFFFWSEPVEENGAGMADNTLHRGLTDFPESFDSQKTSSVQASTVFRDIGEGLMSYAADGRLVPGAAESWELNEDGKVYTFRLRPEGRWSNGDPVTADDFVFTFRRLANPATAAPYTKSLAPVAGVGEDGNALGVRAVDPLTLEITLSQPTPYFLGLLAHPSTHPKNERNIVQFGAEYVRPGNLVTNGPYRLVAARTGALIELERNENYWNNANTAIDRVHYHVNTEPMTQYNRYRAGELHITSTVPPSIFQSIREQFPNALRVSPNLGVYYYGLNVRTEPFKDNKPLREALSMAIDREVLAELVVGRGELPAYSFVPLGIPGYDPPQLTFSNMSQQERNAQARRLYYSAGYSDDNPASFELLYNAGDEHRQLAVAVQDMWRDALGAEVELVPMEFRVWLDRMFAGETEAFRSAWNADYADAHAFVSILATGHEQNLPGWSNAEFDSLMQRAATQTDPDTRSRFLEEAERVLLSEHVVLPLYFYVSKHLVSPDVLGWEDNILDYHYSHHLSLRPAAGGN